MLTLHELIGHIGVNTDSIMRNMQFLMAQAGRVFEGRSNGVWAERTSKKWLLKCVLDTEFEPLLNNRLKRWRNFVWECPEFVIEQLELILAEFPNGDMDFCNLMSLTKEVRNILKHSSDSLSEDEKRKVTGLGMVYFDFSNKLVSWFDHDPLQQLIIEGQQGVDRNFPKKIYSRYKRVTILAYLLGYAGACFVTFGVPEHNVKQRKWCLFCFRRAMIRSKYCAVHDTTNENKAQFRAGRKFYDLLNKDPSKIKFWTEYRKKIIEIEGLSKEMNDPFTTNPYLWKQSLIQLVNESHVLATHLSVTEINSLSNWKEAVLFLRRKFSNEHERSFHIEVVRFWLYMAIDWFEVEDQFIANPNRTVRRVSKSPVSSIPTEIQIAQYCENNPGISKSEIARILKNSPQSVGQMIQRTPSLHKYFLKER